MQTYIGVKKIEAEPKVRDGQEGYKVVYDGGYESWSPKEVFESAYLPIVRHDSISTEDVQLLVADTEVVTLGEKTTVVQTTLRNGFIITSSSSCVDPENYSEELGTEICNRKTEDKIWELLGFVLQWAQKGLKG